VADLQSRLQRHKKEGDTRKRVTQQLASRDCLLSCCCCVVALCFGFMLCRARG
jgi:hypothetical protein